MDPETSPSTPHAMVNFTLLTPSTASVLTPRLGTLAFAGRKPISTPNFVSLTSRGAVSHISHDVMREQTAIGSLYFGLEDFIERQEKKRTVPIYNIPTASHESALRKFTSFPDDFLLILGPRRVPPIPCAPDNTPNSISILTSVGFRQLDANQYIEAVQKLRPDIAVGMADLVLGKRAGSKRQGKMVDRTHAYTMHGTDKLYGSSDGPSSAAYFAPVLPLENTQQLLYLEELEGDELRPHVSGLALYNTTSLSIVPETLGTLPRVLFDEPASPHDILRQVALGADLVTIPFLGAVSDAGIALDFVFPHPHSSDAPTPKDQPLAFDLWSSEYKTDIAPLQQDCGCYACRSHHRAYINHLLHAKEMLAWTLLQLHNYHVMDRFFAAIRESIQRRTFEADVQAFQRVYASELPEKTGQGPRLRGHHLPATGPHAPRRARAWGRLDDAVTRFSESPSAVATPDTGADGLEERGFAEKQSA
ncbi:tRNA-guanine transglycosylase family protein [Aspergillus terreus]|uniref:Queuine tRNA-ribosyltransferase accessory subunit 2 n=1 Tax=Aspergillus terreus TaxID=33178 RepID=A0A5M3ZE16_ASPTE|nr:hypothetical protein ATETN484_0013011600 [Aspergillus terreus]GFF20350.1 tRNA-guanine transglycosylase family protein [Aspergillus terreus]